MHTNFFLNFTNLHLLLLSCFPRLFFTVLDEDDFNASDQEESSSSSEEEDGESSEEDSDYDVPAKRNRSSRTRAPRGSRKKRLRTDMKTVDEKYRTGGKKRRNNFGIFVDRSNLGILRCGELNVYNTHIQSSQKDRVHSWKQLPPPWSATTINENGSNTDNNDNNDNNDDGNGGGGDGGESVTSLSLLKREKLQPQTYHEATLKCFGVDARDATTTKQSLANSNNNNTDNGNGSSSSSSSGGDVDVEGKVKNWRLYLVIFKVLYEESPVCVYQCTRSLLADLYVFVLIHFCFRIFIHVISLFH